MRSCRRLRRQSRPVFVDVPDVLPQAECNAIKASEFDSGFTKITDRNVSRFVNGHSGYVTNVQLES